MAGRVKIVFAVDYTSSMASYMVPIRTMVMSIALIVLRGNVGCVGLVKFRSIYDSWRVKVHGFTTNLRTFQEWFRSDEPGGVCPDGCEGVGDALEETLNIEWNLDDKNGVSTEKLVVLITDGAPNGLFTKLNGQDPWLMSKELEKRGIYLAVIGVGNGVSACDDFYYALAANTGGIYIPMVNAQRILRFIIQSVINNETTFPYAFRGVTMQDIEKNSTFNYLYMEARINGMINECETINDIVQEFFKRPGSDF